MEEQLPAPSELFVDPVSGIDAAKPEPSSKATVPEHLRVSGSLLMGESDNRSPIPAGSQAQPYKTLSFALRQAGLGTIIYLQPGCYTPEQEEQFPLCIPPGVVVVGDVPQRGKAVEIVGSGEWESPIFGSQNAALVLGEMAQVRGVTVTNPHPQGTGIWIEAAGGTIAHCTIRDCGREGIFVTGTATPIVLNCWLLNNRASGMTLTRYGKGEIQRSVFSQNRFGVTMSDFAAPLVSHSEISTNQIGMVLSGSSRPVLRECQIVANQGEGLVIFSQAMPDLGDRQSPAGNRFQFNGDVAVRNVGLVPAIAAGNWLHPQAVRGNVEFRALQPVQRESGQRGDGQRESKQRESKQREDFKAPEFSVNPPDVPPASNPAAPPDLGSHWSLPFVAEILSRRIMGCFREGTFQPDRPITRAQFAALIVRAFGAINPDSANSPNEKPADSQTSAFRDISADHWAAQPIAQAAQMGFLAAEADGTFYPEQPLPKWQAIVWLVNGLRQKGLDLKGGTPDLLRIFRDRVQIPSPATTAVSAAVAHRLLVLPTVDHPAETPQTYQLSPLSPVSRAEIAAWVYQALVLLGEVKTSALS
ncbi:DUF1565 domain-containing protein [Leptolyngbya ohadii]|uniref:DUF1565 domain-containing protein n=1 Tax=Leptolyngbya ohadii TaxID=1962290 RepID=UPI000B59AED1|nr:DUF1565 domain-containing protein [Leptolyngbya ohadii]